MDLFVWSLHVLEFVDKMEKSSVIEWAHSELNQFKFDRQVGERSDNIFFNMKTIIKEKSLILSTPFCTRVDLSNHISVSFPIQHFFFFLSAHTTIQSQTNWERWR